MTLNCSQLHSLKHLRSVKPEQLWVIAASLRREIISSVPITGGHLASSLGAVEISMALHYVFDTPKDKVVWDIGHQAYAHKILTGRAGAHFKTLRQANGISGFLKRAESPFDCFGAGHAGTSISAAAGISQALQNTDDTAYTIAIIGDASIASGLAFEALNHVGELQLRRFIVVLNDNGMSIGPAVGALARTAKTKALDAFFTNLGFSYLGPVDGHDLASLTLVFEQARLIAKPVLIHARTQKGKGYLPAEQAPTLWHGINANSFSSIHGAKHFNHTPAKNNYTDVFGQTLLELARRDPSIVGITAGMASGTGLDRLHKELPSSFFDVGICEQHAVTFAAGLACQGFRPVCALYSTFLQRACDQIIHDVALQRLPVVFAVDRAGVVGADGETHQGVFDLALLRSIPNLTIMSPKDENELRRMLATCLSLNQPSLIRFPRAEAVGVALEDPIKPIVIGEPELLGSGSDALLIAFGPLVQQALELQRILRLEYGAEISVINARFVKPLDVDFYKKLLPCFPIICTLEDHALMGGFGSALLELINDEHIPLQTHVCRFGVNDSFVPQATPEAQHRMNGYDLASLLGYFQQNLPLKSQVALA